MINVKVHWSSKGDFKDSINLMKKWGKLSPEKRLSNVGKMYVKAIKANTPVETGELANGFDYEISKEKGMNTMTVTNNSHPEWSGLIEGLELGHGTGTGGYVPGRHFVKKSVDSIVPAVSKEIDGVITDVK